jgi:hypothetical protein
MRARRCARDMVKAFSLENERTGPPRGNFSGASRFARIFGVQVLGEGRPEHLRLRLAEKGTTSVATSSRTQACFVSFHFSILYASSTTHLINKQKAFAKSIFDRHSRVAGSRVPKDACAHTSRLSYTITHLSTVADHDSPSSLLDAWTG